MSLEKTTTKRQADSLFYKLGVLDRWLAPIVLVTMIVGCTVGATTGDAIPKAFDQVQFQHVSFPIALGLLVMMWPILTKVQYERLPEIFLSRTIWVHIGISLVLNWIIGPFLMLGLAWATLPDLPGYRTGVILVGIARCIAMVAIWSSIACGDQNMCAILIIINSILQMALFSPMALLFINVISDADTGPLSLAYGSVALDVLIYLGIPLAAGILTRYLVWYTTSKSFLQDKFLPFFGPLALVGLLYTVFVIFAYQGNHVVHNLGPVFRTFVPLLLYFAIMWTATFALIYYFDRRYGQRQGYGYERAVVQAFTAASNNFELAIAVAIAAYGVESEQALAATIGPLVEVPVLLSLTYLALYARRRLHWRSTDEKEADQESKQDTLV